ncbi:MAG: hypothetical protein GY757_04970 [bacterium]|nr:hypothetical protein [bacterium]
MKHNDEKINITKVLLLLLLFLPGLLFSREKPAEKSIPDGPYLGQKVPGNTPEPFAPGIVSSPKVEHSPAVFAPGGKEVYWTKLFNNSPSGVIVFSKWENNTWSQPKPASFSGGPHSDDTPAFHPGGNKLFFCSNRPLDGKEKADSTKKKSWNIWFVERTPNGWGNPRHLGPDITAAPNAYPCISTNGTLYYASWRSAAGSTRDIYQAKPGKKGFLKPEKLGPEINSPSSDGYPYISADEHFLIFESDRPGGFGGLDLYISFRQKDGSLGKAQNMGSTINSEHDDRFGWLSHDAKYFFFGSNRNGNYDVFWLPVSALPFGSAMSTLTQ